MVNDNSQKSFWWYFIRVFLFTLAFIITILLLSDWNYGINKAVGSDWELSSFRFWLVVLIYIALITGFLSMITVLVMKIVKLTK
jgi:uncharacterized membrane protein YhaH (DUF805 family)